MCHFLDLSLGCGGEGWLALGIPTWTTYCERHTKRAAPFGPCIRAVVGQDLKKWRVLVTGERRRLDR